VTCAVILSSKFHDPNDFEKTEPQLRVLVRLIRTDREYCDFECLNEMTSVRHCLSGSSNREVTTFHWGVFFSW